jgi:hypothetical protein
MNVIIIALNSLKSVIFKNDLFIFPLFCLHVLFWCMFVALMTMTITMTTTITMMMITRNHNFNVLWFKTIQVSTSLSSSSKPVLLPCLSLLLTGYSNAINVGAISVIYPVLSRIVSVETFITVYVDMQRRGNQISTQTLHPSRRATEWYSAVLRLLLSRCVSNRSLP